MLERTSARTFCFMESFNAAEISGRRIRCNADRISRNSDWCSRQSGQVSRWALTASASASAVKPSVYKAKLDCRSEHFIALPELKRMADLPRLQLAFGGGYVLVVTRLSGSAASSGLSHRCCWSIQIRRVTARSRLPHPTKFVHFLDLSLAPILFSFQK